MRTTQHTEDPNGSTITIDTPNEDCGQSSTAIRLWTADFTYIGSWCFPCKRFHNA
jgi:hypothetical protein